MPDASGRIRGTGWSRRSEAAFDRLAAEKAKHPRRSGVLDLMAAFEASKADCVPAEPPREVWYDPQNLWLADRTAAEADGWGAEDYDQRRSAWRPSD